jgi:hypothetical protein
MNLAVVGRIFSFPFFPFSFVCSEFAEGMGEKAQAKG